MLGPQNQLCLLELAGVRAGGGESAQLRVDDGAQGVEPLSGDGSGDDAEVAVEALAVLIREDVGGEGVVVDERLWEARGTRAGKDRGGFRLGGRPGERLYAVIELGDFAIERLLALARLDVVENLALERDLGLGPASFRADREEACDELALARLQVRRGRLRAGGGA